MSNKPSSSKVLRKKTLARAVTKEMKQQNVSIENNFKDMWNDLEAIYVSISDALVTVISEMSSIVKNEELIKHINDVKQFNTYIATLSDDSQKIASDLKTIHDKHEGRTGQPIDEDDLTFCLALFEDYNQINSYFHSNISTNMIYIGEMLDQVQHKMNESIESSIPTEPTVISSEVIQ